MQNSKFSSTKSNHIQNPDGFTVVWTPSNEHPKELNKFGDYLIKFNSNDVALAHICGLKSEGNTLLILTDFEPLAVFESLVPIQAIYLFGKKNENNRYEKEDHRKLVDIFEDINELIDRLSKDMLVFSQRNVLPISFSSITENKMEQSLTSLQGFTLPFLWNQCFFHYLLKPANVSVEDLKKEMLTQCRLEYQNNQTELAKIDEFDRCHLSEGILKWYTNDSFLYRLLNKALRTRNIELICKFRYCIILLHQKFEDLAKEQQESPSCVYRGQLLNEDTLQALQSNVGHLISMNAFMSTTRNEDIARQFCAGATNAVTFQINIDSEMSQKSKQFIDISHLSSMPHEEEILFFPGTLFSIDSVENKPDSTWFVKLTLRNEVSKCIEMLVPVFEQYIAKPYISFDLFMRTDDFNMIDRYYSMLTKKIFSSENNPTTMIYIYIAFSFSNLGLYKEAIGFYKMAISEGNISINSPEFTVLYMIIGYLHFHLSEYNSAFLYYAVVLAMLTESDLLTSEVYSHIGDVWNKTKNEDIALSYYQDALKIANNQDVPSLPNIYQSIIDIYKKNGHIYEASVYEKEAEEIDYNQYHILTSKLNDDTLSECQSQLKNNGNLTATQRGSLLYKSGLCLLKKGDCSNALKNLSEAKDTLLKVPLSRDRYDGQLPSLFDNIAFVFLLLKDHLQALVMWKKSIDLRSCSYSR